MVATYCTGQAGRDRNDHQLAAGEYRADDGQQHTEGTPGSAGSESQAHSDHEDNSRQEVCKGAGAVADKLCHKHLGTQLIGHTGQRPGKGQDQHGRNHCLKAGNQCVRKILSGNDLTGNVQHEGEHQCDKSTQNQAHGSIGRSKRIHKVHIAAGIGGKEAAGIDHRSDTGNDQRQNGQNQVIDLALLILFVLRNIGIGTGSSGEQIAIHSVALMDAHSAEIKLQKRHYKDCEDSQQGVKVIGNGLNEQGQALALRSDTGNSGCPGRNGRNDADGCSGGIDHVGQLCPGDLVLVSDGTHNRTHRQTVKVVINKDQHAQNSSSGDSTGSGLDVLAGPTAIGSGTTGLIDQRHHHAKKHQEYQNAHIPGVAKLGDHFVKGSGHHAPGAEIGMDQRTGQDTDEQRSVNLLGDQSQHDGNNRRQQGDDGSIAANICPNGLDGCIDVLIKVFVGTHIVRITIQVIQRGFGVCVVVGADHQGHGAKQCRHQEQQRQGSQGSSHNLSFLS